MGLNLFDVLNKQNSKSSVGQSGKGLFPDSQLGGNKTVQRLSNSLNLSLIEFSKPISLEVFFWD